MTGPLSDITVVEFAGLGAGPYAAMLLADMGATVIRIERPGARPATATAISERGRAKRYPPTSRIGKISRACESSSAAPTR
jgi:alpha-methylacyl-CoA racemase